LPPKVSKRYEARVPASTLSVVDGKVTPQTETLQALNARNPPAGVRRMRRP
jgi:hypothetical protein